jgi:hypothetical protein
MIGPFAQFLKEECIVAQYTILSTLQQNGVAERRNHTLMDMVKSMLSNYELPLFLWSEVLKFVVYVLTRSHPRLSLIHLLNNEMDGNQV